jgi:hypothetical protein
MQSPYDHRNRPEVQQLLKSLPAVEHIPVVGAADLREIVKVFAGIPELKYPVNSAGELIAQLDQHGRGIEIVGMGVDPLRMIKYMPAYYFPIASVENFIEKMAELVRANRKVTDVPTELARLTRQLPQLNFPINDADHLLKSVGRDRTYVFQGLPIKPDEMVKRIPREYFPITSQEDFENKVSQLMQTRDLIVKE